jgi:uncharacterized protein with HEPN domain
MLSETERDSLSDIIFNIDLSNTFAKGFDYERFQTDMRTFYAITRCPEIISEASRRLSPETKARHPDIPWRQVSASGNTYRHDYEAPIVSYGAPSMSFCPPSGSWRKPSLGKAARPAPRSKTALMRIPEVMWREACGHSPCFAPR